MSHTGLLGNRVNRRLNPWLFRWISRRCVAECGSRGVRRVSPTVTSQMPKQPCRIVRGLGEARGALRPFLFPGQVRGGGAPIGATSSLRLRLSASALRPLARARACRRSIAASFRRRAPLFAEAFASSVSQALAGIVVSRGDPRRRPGTRFCENPFGGAASRSVIQTPLDDALG